MPPSATSTLFLNVQCAIVRRNSRAATDPRSAVDASQVEALTDRDGFRGREIDQ